MLNSISLSLWDMAYGQLTGFCYTQRGASYLFLVFFFSFFKTLNGPFCLVAQISCLNTEWDLYPQKALLFSIQKATDEHHKLGWGEGRERERQKRDVTLYCLINRCIPNYSLSTVSDIDNFTRTSLFLLPVNREIWLNSLAAVKISVFTKWCQLEFFFFFPEFSGFREFQHQRWLLAH